MIIVNTSSSAARSIFFLRFKIASVIMNNPLLSKVWNINVSKPVLKSGSRHQKKPEFNQIFYVNSMAP